MSKTGPIQFIQEVRNEVSKVTWPSRGETLTTTLIVFIFCLIAAIFFFVGDQIMSFGIKLIPCLSAILEQDKVREKMTGCAGTFAKIIRESHTSLEIAL